MIPTLHRIKPLLLSFLILVALSTHSSRAAAAEAEAIVAGGCFWCVESDFESVPGVSEVVSGYTGGDVENPTYRQVASKGTGHYEAVRITYDPDVISYGKLLDLFFRSVDPTDAGGQFCDRGSPYYTAIFVSNPAEKQIAEAAKTAAQNALGQKVVTPILNAAPFYEAEEYHQDYYKSRDKILTRFGVKTKADAYKLYRKGCGRDARIKALWGGDAPFLSH